MRKARWWLEVKARTLGVEPAEIVKLDDYQLSIQLNALRKHAGISRKQLKRMIAGKEERRHAI